MQKNHHYNHSSEDIDILAGIQIRAFTVITLHKESHKIPVRRGEQSDTIPRKEFTASPKDVPNNFDRKDCGLSISGSKL